MSSTLIVGCGYLGLRVGWLLAQRGEAVHGTVRTAARAVRLTEAGIEPTIADVLDPATLAALPACDRVLYCVGFDRSAGVPMRSVFIDGLRNVLDRVVAGLTGPFVYASSTGVYGQNDGGWVVEESPAEPRHESGRVGLDAESLVRSRCGELGKPAVILRFSGLYGPGRILRRAELARGQAIAGDPDKPLNLIQIDDAARAAVAALDRGEPGRTYLVSDDRPAARREYYTLVAECLNAPAPRFEPPTPGSLEAQREESNKRVSNRRLRTELGVSLLYSDFTTGVPASLRAEEADKNPIG